MIKKEEDIFLENFITTGKLNIIDINDDISISPANK